MFWDKIQSIDTWPLCYKSRSIDTCRHQYQQYFIQKYSLSNFNERCTLVACSQILVQSKCPCSGLLTTWPWQSKPKISLPTLLVLPDSISCLWRNSRCLARPRPLSSSPCVNTPSNVLLPASTFPTTAILKSTISHSNYYHMYIFDYSFFYHSWWPVVPVVFQ